MKIICYSIYKDPEDFLRYGKAFISENNTEKIQLLRISKYSEYNRTRYEDIHLFEMAFTHENDLEEFMVKLNSVGIPSQNEQVDEILDLRLLPATNSRFLLYKKDFSKSHLSFSIRKCVRSKEDEIIFLKRTLFFLRKFATFVALDKKTYENAFECFGLAKLLQQRIPMVMAASLGLTFTLFGLKGRDIAQRIGYFIPPESAHSLSLVNKACAEEVRKLTKI